MRSHFDALVRDNPMRIEIARFRRRFLGFGGSGLTSAILALVALGYVGIVMLVIDMKGDLPPIALIVFQTVLFCFFGPAMLHGSIAGERERRSWDLLLVAPISKAQIVAGKFMGAMVALGLGALAMALPIGIAAVAYRTSTQYLDTGSGVTQVYNNVGTNYWDLALAEGVSLAFCMLVCAWTIFLSARVKRSFMALGATLGSLTVALVVTPLLFASLMGGDQFSAELFLYLNPFGALVAIMDPHHSIAGEHALVASAFYGVPQLLVYLGLTAALLVYAEKTLHFPENEVKFIPQGHLDA